MFSGQDAVELGGDAQQRYHLALRVLGQGDLNAVDIGQHYHECLLKDFDCLRLGEQLFMVPLSLVVVSLRGSISMITLRDALLPNHLLLVGQAGMLISCLPHAPAMLRIISPRPGPSVFIF